MTGTPEPGITDAERLHLRHLAQANHAAQGPLEPELLQRLAPLVGDLLAPIPAQHCNQPATAA